MTRNERYLDSIPGSGRNGCFAILSINGLVVSLKQTWKFVVAATGNNPNHEAMVARERRPVGELLPAQLKMFRCQSLRQVAIREFDFQQWPAQGQNW